MSQISAALVKSLRERTGLGMMDCKKALVASNGDIERAIIDLRKQSGLKAAKKAGRIAADGLLALAVNPDGTAAALAEVNIETDFAARNPDFVTFVESVAQMTLAHESDDIQTLLERGLEKQRAALVQSIGENIHVRRLKILKVDPRASGVIGTYLHTNRKVGALVELCGGDTGLGREIAMHITAMDPMVIRPGDLPEAILAREREIYLTQAQDSSKPAAVVDRIVAGRTSKFIAANSLLEQPFVKDQDTTIRQLVTAAGAEIRSFARYEVGAGIDRQTRSFAEEVAEQASRS